MNNEKMNKEFSSDKKPLKVKDGIDWSNVSYWDNSLEITNKTPKIYTSTPKIYTSTSEGIVFTKRGKNNEKH